MRNLKGTLFKPIVANPRDCSKLLTLQHDGRPHGEFMECYVFFFSLGHILSISTPVQSKNNIFGFDLVGRNKGLPNFYLT